MRMSVFVAALFFVAPLVAAEDPPETVVVTYSPKPGREAEVERLIGEHFATVQRLGLITADPHVTYRDNDEGGKPILVDILTWKGHEIPDDAPAEVRAIWKSMEGAVETRGKRRGIALHEVHFVAPRH